MDIDNNGCGELNLSPIQKLPHSESHISCNNNIEMPLVKENCNSDNDNNSESSSPMMELDDESGKGELSNEKQ
jgi:hypothetical protein